MTKQPKLRWLRRERRVTPALLHDYQYRYGISLDEAVAMIRDQETTVLQVWQPYDPFGNGTWQDIPTEVIYRD